MSWEPQKGDLVEFESGWSALVVDTYLFPQTGTMHYRVLLHDGSLYWAQATEIRQWQEGPVPAGPS